MTIIQIYVPNTDAEEEEVNEFYDYLQFEMDETWKQNVHFGWEPKSEVENIKEENVLRLHGLGNLNEAGLWCWKRFLRIPWIAKKTNKLIIKQFNPMFLLEAWMAKLRLSFQPYYANT